MVIDTQHDSSFRLVQLSDCHIPALPETPYRGLNADVGLAGVLQAVKAWRPDAILLTGDLSEDASNASYDRLAAQVHALGVPVFALPGNHDDPAIMRGYFSSGPYERPLVETFGRWKIALLNTARPGRIDGCLDDVDLDVLAEELPGNQPGLLALHHQPVEINAPWIDRYMLESPGAFLQRIREIENLKVVTWGHVHQVFERTIGNLRFLSAPSTAANSLPNCQRFTLDPFGPACRWFELHEDGTLATGILHASA